MSPEADSAPDGTSPSAGVLGGRGPEAALALPASLPRMAPELALQTFEQHAARQLNAPVSYSANTVIEAELPDTAQRGRFQLRRRFIAPKTLLFTPVRFVGDNFVKSNVIARLLQAEVAHVGKDESTRTAISEANYKFSYKGMGEIDGRPMHVFHVKPRHKRPGLFKGRIYLDASTGSLRRTEGTLVKTDSFFVKRIEFAQDYADIEGYTLPVHASSVAKTRLVGRALVEIATDDYDLSSTAASAATLAVSGDQ
ncbi:MAG TPA: hypothetical protein VMT05_00190 [Terriglobales bacterium]|jgi:hypothetical protein|nr:hypothetical protein [Terriglobales bacterium]